MEGNFKTICSPARSRATPGNLPLRLFIFWGEFNGLYVQRGRVGSRVCGDDVALEWEAAVM